MARYEHLPLFKLVYDFILYFFKLSRGFAKDFKYGLAVELRNNLTQLLDKIIIANNLEDKEKTLKQAKIILEQIKLKIRILKDLDVINLKSYEFCTRYMIAIAKQVNAWQSWSEGGRNQSRLL